MKALFLIALHLLLRITHSYEILTKKTPDLTCGCSSSPLFKNSGAQQKWLLKRHNFKRPGSLPKFTKEHTPASFLLPVGMRKPLLNGAESSFVHFRLLSNIVSSGDSSQWGHYSFRIGTKDTWCSHCTRETTVPTHCHFSFSLAASV